MSDGFDPVRRVTRTSWRDGAMSSGERAVPEEAAIAFSYNGFAYAVMMATPADLEDFALGFSLTEGVIEKSAELRDIEVVEAPQGIELRLRITAPRMAAFADRRRAIVGATGCGMCGIENIAKAMRAPPRVTSDLRFAPAELGFAVGALSELQDINRETRAVHAAAFWRPEQGILALREDVGRHNALDKLAGALARDGVAAAQGVVLLTSRVSVEMVQKTAIMGAPVIAAVSAPTALALRVADEAGITLIGVARDDGFEIFTHGERVAAEDHVV